MTNDVQTLLGAVRNTAEKRIAGEAARIDRERAFPVENLRALGELGALGLVVPAEYGGAGGGLAALAEACEAVGAACASTGMVFLMHAVTAATVAAGGGPRAADLLPKMASWCGARDPRVQRARHRRALLLAGAAAPSARTAA